MSTDDKKRVTGLGGIFFKCQDPQAIRDWYGKHLGLNNDEYGTSFEWRKADRPEERGFTAWSPFPESTKYFEPSKQPFMVNFRVEDLEWLVLKLKEEGVVVVDEIETFEYGKFVHILDPEGNKIELWEADDKEYDAMINARTN